MRVRIHRGTAEIGGNCIELEAEGKRIVLDLGRPLWASDDEPVPLPNVAGFHADDPSLLGVVLSHAHQDHWGLMASLPPDVQVYAGRATAAILREAAFFTEGIDLKSAAHLEHEVPLSVGPFTITPFLNDHSAFDTYSLLVDADGSRLFYSADFRAHGAKAALFESLIDDPPTGVDVLLLEGTKIPEHGTPERDQMTERQLAARCAQIMADTPGMTLLSYSTQNIDRIVQLYRAAKATDRQFVMDLYTARVIEATGYETLPRPHPGWPTVRVYIPLWQRIKVKEAKAFDMVGGNIKAARIYEEELAAEPRRFATKFSRQTLRALARAGALEGARAIWSLWSGYLDEPSGKRLVADLDEHGISLTQLHVSGHASLHDLQRLSTAIGAREVVPIHSAATGRFREFFDNVALKTDGEWWEVRR